MNATNDVEIHTEKQTSEIHQGSKPLKIKPSFIDKKLCSTFTIFLHPGEY